MLNALKVVVRSGLIETRETRLAKKESITPVVQCSGKVFLCLERLKKTSCKSGDTESFSRFQAKLRMQSIKALSLPSFWAGFCRYEDAI